MKHELKLALQPFADDFEALCDKYTRTVKRMSKASLEQLYKATRKAKGHNCLWSAFRAARELDQLVVRELIDRGMWNDTPRD